MFTLNNNSNIQIIEELDINSSSGNLRKWLGMDSSDNTSYYIKSNSKNNNKYTGYEPEVECITSRLANMLGLNSVLYYMDKLNIGAKTYKVCISADYSYGMERIPLAQLAPDSAKLYGVEKYNYVIGKVPNYKQYIDQILLFDYIIGNTDRHLNNIEFLSDGQTLEPAPIYDNGASLFSNQSVKSINQFWNTNLNFCKSKPFFNTHNEQIKLISDTKLQKLHIEDVYKLVNTYLNGERAKLVNKWLKIRLEECDLLW